MYLTFLLLLTFFNGLTVGSQVEPQQHRDEDTATDATASSPAYLSRASEHYRKGRYNAAIADYLAALRQYKPAGEVDSLVVIFNGLGGIYAELEEYEKSISHYQKAIRFAEHTGDIANRASAYANIGTVYRQLDSSEVALEYLNKGLELAETLGNPEYLAQSLLNIGNVNVNLGNYYKALANYRMSLAYCYEAGIDFGSMINYVNIGGVYMHVRDYPNAKVAYDSAMVYAKRLELPYEEAKLQEHLTSLYTETGNFRAALDHHKAFYTLRQKLIDEEKQKAIAELEVKYETALKDQEIELVSRKFEQKRAQNQALVLAIVLVVVAAGALWYFMRYRHRALRSLYQRNIELLNTLQVAKAPPSAADPANEGKDNMLQEIFSKLLILMEQDELYKNPNLTIRDVTEKLLTNEKYVSTAIATHTNMNYSTFINFYRINEAKRLIHASHGKAVLSEVMLSCGFSSRTTFYNAFNKLTGMPPVQFKLLAQSPLTPDEV